MKRFLNTAFALVLVTALSFVPDAASTQTNAEPNETDIPFLDLGSKITQSVIDRESGILALTTRDKLAIVDVKTESILCSIPLSEMTFLKAVGREYLVTRDDHSRRASVYRTSDLGLEAQIVTPEGFHSGVFISDSHFLCRGRNYLRLFRTSDWKEDWESPLAKLFSIPFYHRNTMRTESGHLFIGGAHYDPIKGQVESLHTSSSRMVAHFSSSERVRRVGRFPTPWGYGPLGVATGLSYSHIGDTLEVLISDHPSVATISHGRRGSEKPSIDFLSIRDGKKLESIPSSQVFPRKSRRAEALYLSLNKLVVQHWNGISFVSMPELPETEVPMYFDHAMLKTLRVDGDSPEQAEIPVHLHGAYSDVAYQVIESDYNALRFNPESMNITLDRAQALKLAREFMKYRISQTMYLASSEATMLKYIEQQNELLCGLLGLAENEFPMLFGLDLVASSKKVKGKEGQETKCGIPVSYYVVLKKNEVEALIKEHFHALNNPNYAKIVETELYDQTYNFHLNQLFREQREKRERR